MPTRHGGLTAETGTTEAEKTGYLVTESETVLSQVSSAESITG
jgi:hypothetical protein